MFIAKMPNGLPEIYLARQGEGPTVGEERILVRMSKCNLCCHFCDSAFTWCFNESKFKNNAVYMEPVYKDDVQTFISEKGLLHDLNDLRKKTGVNKFILTGGEPLLQQTDLRSVMLSLEPEYVEIETNGTVMLNHTDWFNQINCSPKLPSSGNEKRFARRYDVIEQYCKLKKTNKVIFKFVVHTDSEEKFTEDYDEILAWLDYHIKDVSIEDMWLMPEGITRCKIEDGMKFLEEKKKSGAIFQKINISNREHIIKYGNKRGT